MHGTCVHAWVFPKRKGSPEPLRGGVFLVSCSMLPAWFLALYMGFGIWVSGGKSNLVAGLGVRRKSFSP